MESHCELIITSDSVSADEISNQLGIDPHRHFNKGDVFITKHSGSTGKKKYTLWAVKSKSIVSIDEDVSGHIEYISSLFKEKLDVLREFKCNPAYTVSVWIWVETDNAGIGFDLTEKEISFFNEIANRIQFSLIANKTITTEEQTEN